MSLQPIIGSVAAILRDSTVVVVRTRLRAIPLAIIATRKSTHGFPFVSYMGMGLRLAALRAARAPLLTVTTKKQKERKHICCDCRLEIGSKIKFSIND